MKKITLLFVFLFVSIGVFPQSNKLDKKMENAYELVEKGKIKDAGEYMEKLLEDNPEYGKGWDYLAKIRYKEYQDSKKTDDLFKNLTVTTKDKNGKEIKGD
jgi:predicted Zn-dependent protease